MFRKTRDGSKINKTCKDKEKNLTIVGHFLVLDLYVDALSFDVTPWVLCCWFILNLDNALSVLVRDRQRNDTLDQTDPYKYNLLPSRLVSKKGHSSCYIWL